MTLLTFLHWTRAKNSASVAIRLCAAAAIGMAATTAFAVPHNLATSGTAYAPQSDFGATIESGIDGNRDGNFGNGSVFYENANPNGLYYEVDLGVNAYIDRVQVLRRTDADQAVFGNMRLTIFADDGAGNPGTVAFTKDYLSGNPENNDGGFELGTWGATDMSLNAPTGLQGRHVRLERIDGNYWLTFAEFEVIGDTVPTPFVEANNIARGKPVTFSSGPDYGALESSGNDGLIDSNFGAGAYRPVYHSALAQVGEYWQVDLGAMTQLDRLELFTRTDEGRTDDGNPETGPDPLYVTTSEFKVSVLNESFSEVTSFIVQNTPPDIANQYDNLINAAGATGRYIRVETTKAEFLAFAELRAFAGPGSTFDPADFNEDGFVNGSDLAKWRGDFGLNAGSDADNDGDSDGADFLVWQRSLNGSPSSPAVGAIPEPGSASLAVLCAAISAVMARGRRWA
jgi:hypothetical protein